MYLDDIKEIFERTSGIPQHEIRPCFEDDVLSLERDLGLDLPLAYREWLLWMGRGAGPFLRGTDVFFVDNLAELRVGALELFHVNGLDGALPNDAIVFYLHQGYIVHFLRASEGDNPPVYGYAEDGRTDGPTLCYKNLSEWMRTELEVHLSYMRRSNW